MIKEEDRLAAVIAQIDEEVAVVPRGAYYKVPQGTIIKNRSFEGESSITGVDLVTGISSLIRPREKVCLSSCPFMSKITRICQSIFFKGFDQPSQLVGMYEG